jgi:hypothetical protein
MPLGRDSPKTPLLTTPGFDSRRGQINAGNAAIADNARELLASVVARPLDTSL